MTQKEIYAEAFGGYIDFQNEIKEKNTKILEDIKNQYPLEFYNSILLVIEDVSDYDNSESMSIVEEPTGDKQNQNHGLIKTVWVDQWSMGTEGDSFAGYFYVQLTDSSFLKIPYSC